MNEKKLFISQLYDFYGSLLTEKQQYAVEMYYNDDLSLSEIAESIGITRQGVRDLIVRSEKMLEDAEAKLGIAERYQNMIPIFEDVLSFAENIKSVNSQNSKNTEIDLLADKISGRIKQAKLYEFNEKE